MVVAAHILGKAGTSVKAKETVKTVATGIRKLKIYDSGSAKERVEQLAGQLVNDGYDFTVSASLDTPIAQADRVVSAGKGIGDKENMGRTENWARVIYFRGKEKVRKEAQR